MFKATIRSLLSHKLRLGMTALAIVLGVAFVGGTFILTDTLNDTFETLFKDVNAGTDVIVRGTSELDDDSGSRSPVPAELVEEISQLEGVSVAEGGVFGYAQFLDKDGEVIAPQAPTLGVNWADNDELSPLRLRDGAEPVDDNDVAMDAGTADRYGFAVGDQVTVITLDGANEYDLTGIFRFGSADNLAGATLAAFETTTAQRVMDRVGRFDEVAVIGEEDLTDRELSRAVAQAVGQEFDVITSGDLAAEQTAEIKEGLGFFSTMLLTFAAIALFVGSFLISNTFSIIVAQRTRELALMRAIGASRAQVMRSITAEATITGVIAGVIGVGAGVLVAMGLKALLEAIGIDTPTRGVVITPKAIYVPLIAGVVVTVLSAIGPARRATKVPPVAALRDDFAFPQELTRRRIVLGFALLVASIALLLGSLFFGDGSAIALVGLGALGIFLGMAAIAPLLVDPMVKVIGAPMARWLRVPGRLARDNSMRNPRRTASTAAALMIGLALVGFVTIFAASINASTVKLIEGSTRFDFILQTTNFQAVSPTAAENLTALPEVESAVGLRGGEFKLENESKFLLGTDIEDAAKVVRLDVTSGSLEDAYDGGLLVGEPEAEVYGFEAGDTVTLTFGRTGDQDLVIEAIYERNPLAGNYILSLPDYEANYEDQLDFLIAVLKEPGASMAQTRSAVEATVGESFPNLKVLDKQEYLDDQAAQVDQILGLMTALLGLALIIAFIGIVNTLALSIYERTREIGLLRAIGMSRGQLRRMIRWEAVIVSVLGALLGLVIGMFFGWAVVRDISDQGVTEFRLPFGTLLLFVVIAAIAGVAAAVFPARRAAKLDVLQAITTE